MKFIQNVSNLYTEPVYLLFILDSYQQFNLEAVNFNQTIIAKYCIHISHPLRSSTNILGTPHSFVVKVPSPQIKIIMENIWRKR